MWRSVQVRRIFRDREHSWISRSISGYVISPRAPKEEKRRWRSIARVSIRRRLAWPRAPLHDIRTWVKYIDTQYSRRAGTRESIGHSPPRVPRASRLVLFSTRVKLTRTASARKPAAAAAATRYPWRVHLPSSSSQDSTYNGITSSFSRGTQNLFVISARIDRW